MNLIETIQLQKLLELQFLSFFFNLNFLKKLCISHKFIN